MTTVLRVDAEDPLPPYEQLRRQLVALIGGGELAVGARLPPLRQLAADLGLAVGTVARTYRELEAAGMVRSRRGGGTTVVGGPVLPAEVRRGRLEALAWDLVAQARALGVGPDDIRAAVERQLE